MSIGHMSELEEIKVEHPDAKDALMKVAISPKEGWEGYVMRFVEVKPGGYTPKHAHPWPHINYFIEGEGTLLLKGKENSVKAGSYSFVPENELHQFTNTSDQVFKFICIVPQEGHK